MNISQNQILPKVELSGAEMHANTPISSINSSFDSAQSALLSQVQQVCFDFSNSYFGDLYPPNLTYLTCRLLMDLLRDYLKGLYYTLGLSRFDINVYFTI